jgi:mono/diheme cytochrome c family protein
MMHATIARLLLAACLTLSVASAAFAQGTAPAGDPVKGKATFMAENCYLCHGTFGQGGGRAGPKLAPHPIPAAAIMRQLRHPVQNMPPYTTVVLSDAQAADIIAYLQSIKPDKAVKDIPILNLH